SKTESYKTQLEIANAKAKKLLNDREQLISTVSHDLKTPLSTIVGYSELLSNSDLNTKQKHYNKNIKSSSEYISKLVQDLLDFTKIEAGKIVVEPIPFSLSVVIDEVAKNIQAVYSQKEIDLRINIDPEFTKNIVTDPFRLRQILSNLIGNAYKFTLKGSIAIEAKIIDENVSISVIDTGIGIKESSQKIVFEEFTQANDGIEKIFGGTGLGLTIAKKMAETLNGTLKLESKFGYGSTFTIQFPLVWASEQFSMSQAMQGCADVPFAQAVMCLLTEDLQAALHHLDKAHAKQPESAYTLTLRGVVKHMLADHAGAVNDLNVAGRSYKKNVMWKAFQFPDPGARLLVRVDGG
ncbi:MAG: HAMP domain-containing histidine kinase, partial [Flavobacterium sp.]